MAHGNSALSSLPCDLSWLLFISCNGFSLSSFWAFLMATSWLTRGTQALFSLYLPFLPLEFHPACLIVIEASGTTPPNLPFSSSAALAGVPIQILNSPQSEVRKEPTCEWPHGSPGRTGQPAVLRCPLASTEGCLGSTINSYLFALPR